jgi:hypothetical protein
VIFTPLVGPALDMRIVLMKNKLMRWIKIVKNISISQEKFLKSEEKLK